MDTYVISLDDERFATAAAELAPYGLVAQRFEAVRGAALSPEELAATVSVDARVRLPSQSGELPSLGAVGCYLSHVALWRAVVASQRPSLVCEDDVLGLASPAALAGALAAAAEVDADWDVLLLDALLVGRKRLRPTSSPLLSRLPRDGDFICTTAYAITPKGAARLLAGALPLHVQVDGYMSAAARAGDVSVLVASPRVFRQHSKWRSTIQRVSLLERARHTLLRGNRAAPLPLGALLLALVGGAALGVALTAKFRAPPSLSPPLHL